MGEVRLGPLDPRTENVAHARGSFPAWTPLHCALPGAAARAATAAGREALRRAAMAAVPQVPAKARLVMGCHANFNDFYADSRFLYVNAEDVARRLRPGDWLSVSWTSPASTSGSRSTPLTTRTFASTARSTGPGRD